MKEKKEALEVEREAKEKALKEAKTEFESKLEILRGELAVVKEKLARVEMAEIVRERQERLTSFRRPFLIFIDHRFPSLEILAKTRADAVEDYGQLCDLFLKVALTQNVEEAEQVLLQYPQDQLDLNKLPEQE